MEYATAVLQGLAYFQMVSVSTAPRTPLVMAPTPVIHAILGLEVLIANTVTLQLESVLPARLDMVLICIHALSANQATSA